MAASSPVHTSGQVEHVAPDHAGEQDDDLDRTDQHAPRRCGQSQSSAPSSGREKMLRRAGAWVTRAVSRAGR